MNTLASIPTSRLKDFYQCLPEQLWHIKHVILEWRTLCRTPTITFITLLASFIGPGFRLGLLLLVVSAITPKQCCKAFADQTTLGEPPNSGHEFC